MIRVPTAILAMEIAATAFLTIASPWVAAANAQARVGAAESDQATARVNQARPPVDQPIAELEVVETVGRSIPSPLAAQRIETFLTETVTTTKAGRLLVTKSMDLSVTCTPSSGVIYFLIVDDVPVRNSAVFSRTGLVGQVSGVTLDAVAAGTHTIKLGETCTVPGAYPSGTSVALIGLSSVIVLP